MCIIIYKPEGFGMPDKETIETCFWNNPDGAGYMLKRNGVLTMEKGFMRLKGLKRRLKELQVTEKDEFALHFRITTSGGTRKANCHPFQITPNVKDTAFLKDISKREILAGLMHNGVIGQGKDTLSDTMLFVRDTINRQDVFQALQKQDAETVNILAEMTTGSRLLIMQAGRASTIKTGTWTEDEGLFYSNMTYIPWQERYTSYRSTGYTYTHNYSRKYSQNFGKAANTENVYGNGATYKESYLDELPYYFDCPQCDLCIASYECIQGEWQGVPYAVCPQCESPFYKEEIETIYDDDFFDTEKPESGKVK